MQFDLPKDQSSIIKVIGVGGGGSNAVNHMYKQGIKGVDFIVCNTDAQALDISPVPIKVQLGQSLTEGRGAGSQPEVGRNAAIENIDEIREILSKRTTMVFVTAGMGGGTGTGAAPVIAKLAKEMGILTVGIVTIPFTFEGRKRMKQASEGLREMRQAVDTLLIIRNDKLREIYGNLSLHKAFAEADSILTTAAKGIAELISVTGDINVDMNDVNTVMKDSGVAIMGQAMAAGEDRAIKAAKEALESPLLNDNNIEGAKYILLNITYGTTEVMMDEITDITDYIQHAAGLTADVIWGHAMDETLGDKISVTIIATGFKITPETGFELDEPVKMVLNDMVPKQVRPLTAPLTTPVAADPAEPYIKLVEAPVAPKAPVIAEQTEVQKFDLFDAEPVKAEEHKAAEQVLEVAQTNDESIYSISAVEEPRMEAAISSEQKSEPTVTQLHETAAVNNTATHLSDRVTAEVAMQLNRERMRHLREMADRIKSPEGLSVLEKEPAYKRRNIQLDTVPHSSESQVSRYTLSEDTNENGERNVEIKSNNSYLHDNVD
jgi:cell division protein FtsZ